MKTLIIYIWSAIKSQDNIYSFILEVTLVESLGDTQMYSI